MKEIKYEAPISEVIELEVENAILTASGESSIVKGEGEW